LVRASRVAGQAAAGSTHKLANTDCSIHAPEQTFNAPAGLMAECLSVCYWFFEVITMYRKKDMQYYTTAYD